MTFMRFITLTHPLFAMKNVANYVYKSCARGFICLIKAAAVTLPVLGGCAFPDKPTRVTMYDFGPGALLSMQPGTAQASLPPLPPLPLLLPVAIDDIATPGGALDNIAVHYRLGYLEAQQLRAYAQARWSMPPAQLVRQRLREQLSLRRTVVDTQDSLALNRRQNPVLPLQIKLELLEFSHLFTAPDASVGLIRLHATLVQVTPAGENLLAQRSVVVQRPATSADAPGGVRALTAATDAAIEEIDQWLLLSTAR